MSANRANQTAIIRLLQGTDVDFAFVEKSSTTLEELITVLSTQTLEILQITGVTESSSEQILTFGYDDPLVLLGKLIFTTRGDNQGYLFNYPLRLPQGKNFSVACSTASVMNLSLSYRKVLL